MKNNRRSQDRQRCKINIRFSKCRNTPDHDAVILNQSEEGMYFESDRNVSKGDHLLIQTTDNNNPPSKDNGVSAVQVRWRNHNGNGKCGAGAQIKEKASRLSGDKEASPVFYCDSCGRGMAELLMTDDSLQLCPGCFYEYTKLAESKLKNNIRRYMMGNVL